MIGSSSRSEALCGCQIGQERRGNVRHHCTYRLGQETILRQLDDHKKQQRLVKCRRTRRSIFSLATFASQRPLVTSFIGSFSVTDQLRDHPKPVQSNTPLTSAQTPQGATRTNPATFFNGWLAFYDNDLKGSSRNRVGKNGLEMCESTLFLVGFSDL